MSQKQTSRKTAYLSNRAKAFSIASLVRNGKYIFVRVMKGSFHTEWLIFLLFMSTEDLAAELPEGDDNAPAEDGSMERENCDSPVPRKMLKTVKPRVFLEGKELWNCFYRLGTEMIITKTGRSVCSSRLIARSRDKKFTDLK